MPSVALAVACLACAGHGQWEQDHVKHSLHPLKSLAMLLRALQNQSYDAFNPSFPRISISAVNPTPSSAAALTNPDLLGGPVVFAKRTLPGNSIMQSTTAQSIPDRPAMHSLLGSKSALSNVKIVLASQSPRRREILDLIGVEYEVIVSQFEEDLDKANFQGADGPGRYAMTNAVCKAREVLQRCFPESSSPLIVIGADTVVDLDGVVLEKPKSADEAKAMLRRLSGRPHRVHTGVGIFTSRKGIEEPAAEFYESTEVFFGELSEDEIEAYVASGDPMDKAGSYGIQGPGGQFVDRIVGCYFNVMGFPMRRVSVSLFGLLDRVQ